MGTENPTYLSRHQDIEVSILPPSQSIPTPSLITTDPWRAGNRFLFKADSLGSVDSRAPPSPAQPPPLCAQIVYLLNQLD